MTEEVKWERTISDVNDEILVNLENPHKMFYVALAAAVSVLLFAVGMVSYHTAVGPGMWQGFRPPVYWLVDITNFVFWVGIGHAGTLISAILFLFRAKWRNAVNRSAEAMTIFAVICALVFPAIHMGRMYLGAYWAMPFPNTNNLWVNFRSPLFWDVCAISTYFTVSLLFWYILIWPQYETEFLELKKLFTAYFLLDGVAQLASGTTMKQDTAPWQPWRHRSYYLCTRSYLGTSPCRCNQDGTRRFFRRTS